MFDSLKAFLAELAEGRKAASRFEADDYRLAAAALLVHASTIDGPVSEAERRKLHDLLQRRFELDESATAELIDKATQADREAIDLYHFTSLINRTCDLEGRLRIVEMMWEIAFADGRVTEFEENLLWRVSDLLGISANERIALKQRAAGEGEVSAAKDA
jgi:uncharacterized tellurite resistance protein B-like protein